ncbi:MAG: copper resistance protein CopC/CopD, partial [Chloroflexi bacterium]|nr:copper resistance protein CopC/CopD [Chloroflexota bacterium]
MGCALLAPSGPASAHAVQVSSRPAPNEQLAGSPDTISIDFSEPIEGSVSTIQLWDTSPQQLALGPVEFPDDKTMTVAVPDGLAPGLYTVIWRNLSTVDGHTWAGSFPFIVLGPNGELPESTAIPAALANLAKPPSSRPSTLESAARWVVLLGSAVMLGGTAYVLLVTLPATRVLSPESAAGVRKLSRTILLLTTTIAAFFVLQGSLVQLALQADRLGGLGKADELLVDTRLGSYLIARQVLLAVSLLAVVLAWRSGKDARPWAPLGLLLLASLGVLLTQSLVSHAAAASEGALWTTASDVLHLLAASLWVGGLIHVGLAMPRWLDELRGVSRTLFAAESFRRFSALAAFSVLVLMVSGVLSALAQFTAFGQLWSTNYGWSLVAKMAVMLPLLAVAALNGFILQPRIVEASLTVRGAAVEGDAPAAAPVARLQHLLVNTVRLEAVLGIVVLVAVAVLIQLQPPRATAQAQSLSQPAPTEIEDGRYLEAAQSGGLVISLQIEPVQVGQNTFEVGLGSEFGGIGEVEEVRLDFDHADESIGSSRLDMPLAGSAKFLADGSNLSLPGAWKITATVRRRGEEEDVRATFDLTLAAPAAGGGSAADEGSESVWGWPFQDRRTAGAIAALGVG